VSGRVTAALDASALSTFRGGFAGEIVLPEDFGYDAARIVWNSMIDRRPAIVVRPTGVADVLSALRFAREQELVIAVRSGGHSIPGLSTCDEGIVFDLSAMRGVRVDPERRVARVNGGALLAELDHEAQAFGLACPVGVVSHTGVAGLTLGGGMGRLQRKYGLTIDNLLSVDVVTADGRLVHASEDENPDLFWGMRGAGPNFGIVTSFEFRLHPVGPTITHGAVMHPVARAAEVAELYRDLVESTPDEMWSAFGVGLAVPEEEFPPEVAGRPIVFMGGLHCGSLEQAERDFAPMREFGSPIIDTIQPKPYLTAQRMNDEAMRWGHRFSMKSRFTASIAEELVEGCLLEIERAPKGGDCSFSFWSMGRAIARVDVDATAFPTRDAAFWASAEAMWDEPGLDQEHREWVRSGMSAITPFTVAGRYVNDVAESGEDVVRSVYGDAKYERLVHLKRTWDPDNVFRLNQNIRP
jgi:FAD binding domain/Berberine and berberine like